MFATIVIVKRHAKRIIYDIVGLVLIILSPFLGAIPGPGGIIVFFAGLSILAVHNDWAKNLLIWARKNATNMLDLIFAENKKIQLLNDAIGIILLIIGSVIFAYVAPPLRYGLFIAPIAAGIFWLARNRNRYKKFLKR